LSGNGNNGTLINGPTYSNADGGSIVFNSTDPDLVKLNSSFVANLNEFSIDIWMKRSAAADTYLYAEATNSGSNPLWGITSSNDVGYSGYLRVFARNDSGGSELDWEPKDSAFNIYDNTWHNIVFVYSNNLIKFYVDGNIAGSTTWNKGSYNNLQHSTIGAIEYNGGSRIQGINGNVSSVKRYNRALSAAEVAQNYDALRVRYGAYTNTFTPICAGGEGKVEVLCVAGGGGGGGYHSGGGGAGGLLYNSAFSVDSNSGISVTVGGGGTSGTGTSGTGDAGGNSVFGSLTSYGGGAGISQSITPVAKNSGGSGGGGCDGTAASLIGGSGVSGQGFKGGNSLNTSGAALAVRYGTAGGGGAGGEGGPGGAVNGGYGGPGLSYSISGTSTYYAGGGGGTNLGQVSSYGFGGIGGGGDGGTSDNGSSPAKYSLNGTPNTGGGGAGHLYVNQGGGNGANGIVIVRYPATDYNVEVLVVGGGGGGGIDTGGGGGAGGLIYHSSYPVSSGKKLQVTVGKGGPAATSNSFNATSGSNSVFSNQVAFGGGYGSSNTSLSPGGNGGSGGGGGAYSLYQGVGGTGVSGQGNNGGDATAGAGGGGGGAGQSGFGGDTTANGDSASDGGDGLTYSITGSSVVYAAGGGGGQASSDNRGTGGSSGVGGDGGTGTRNPTDPDVNTGSGGGGGSSTNQPNGNRRGTSGADGIVIIAYKGPQRGIGGTIDTTSRPGYTLHKFTTTGTDFFIP
jgi:hypothetical protein